MSTTDELLDMVNDQDEVVGTMPRSQVQASHSSHFRVINAFVRNSKGQLWIPRRGPHKRIFPSCLDMSVGGHVEAGESYDTTFARETKEELNIDVGQVPWRLLGKMTPKQDLVSAFMQVYEISSDDVPNYNKDDFVEYYWFTPEEYFAHLYKGEKVKGDLNQIIRKFYLTN